MKNLAEGIYVRKVDGKGVYTKERYDDEKYALENPNSVLSTKTKQKVQVEYTHTIVSPLVVGVIVAKNPSQ